MMSEKENRKHSLFKKICVPLTVVIFLQAVIFFAATFYGGISDTINQNARDVLTERVINRKSDIETMFNTQWTSFALPESSIRTIYETVQAEADHPVYSDRALQKEVLEQSNDVLVNMIRSNEVTGVFLVLNDAKNYEPRKAGEEQEKYGLCIRDYSPTSEYTAREDLLMIRCPSTMLTKVGFSMENWWEPVFQFRDEMPGNYYYKPMEMAYENPGTSNLNLAYFDGLHNFGGTDQMVVTYSIPLLDTSGYPYGVLGVELTADYLKTLLESTKLYKDNAGCYALVKYEEGKNTYQVIAYDGILYQQCFGSDTEFQTAMTDADWFETGAIQSKIPVCGSLSNMQIYNRNTPFEKERLALVGLVKEDTLYEINTIVRQQILMICGVVLIFGVCSVFMISKRLTRPINKLSQKVHKMDGTKELKLERLNIDEIDELVESIEDLTEKVNRNVTRTEFFSRMSHDMRTPMNAIIGFSSPELLENADKKEMMEYMEKIHASGGFLLTLINDVLDMTKIEMQRMELRAEALTKKSVLDSVTPIISEVAKERKVHFVVEKDDKDTVFLGDKQRISQILMNLLSNAVKFCGEDGTVRLTMEEIGRNSEQVTHEIVVSDTGCGMSEEFQRKMYEPFSQEGKTAGGTGLGLAIAHQMVMLMGGTLTCVSKVNQGTTFTIVLSSPISQQSIDADAASGPVQVQKRNEDYSEEPKSVISMEEQRRRQRLGNKRVLICEDHPLNMQIARRLLEREGMIVEEAYDGAEGVEKFQNSSEGWYQLILMDIRMPKLTGIEAAKAIRAMTRKDAAAIPILAMTANAFKEDVEETRQAGMNEHLSKPIDPKILYLTLEKYL